VPGGVKKRKDPIGAVPIFGARGDRLQRKRQSNPSATSLGQLRRQERFTLWPIFAVGTAL
jgi:hypothetical protein